MNKTVLNFFFFERLVFTDRKSFFFFNLNFRFIQHIIEHAHHLDLYEAVVQQHAGLAGLPQGVAEERYILVAKQLDGYGQETFLARDEQRNPALVGVSLNGIIVGQENNTCTKFYQWKDISNVINHKKQFIIECQCPEDNVQFEFGDPELAKYVWKLCVLQVNI